MMDDYVINEQVYKNITTGEVVQWRQEMLSGKVVWERRDGSIWSSHIDDPNAEMLRPPRSKDKQYVMAI